MQPDNAPDKESTMRQPLTALELLDLSEQAFVAEMIQRFTAAGEPRDEAALDRLARRLAGEGLLF